MLCIGQYQKVMPTVVCDVIGCSFMFMQVGRMYKCLQDYEQTKLAEFAAALDTGEQGLISHMKKSIAIAGDKYLTWRNRKDKS